MESDKKSVVEYLNLKIRGSSEDLESFNKFVSFVYQKGVSVKDTDIVDLCCNGKRLALETNRDVNEELIDQLLSGFVDWKTIREFFRRNSV